MDERTANAMVAACIRQHEQIIRLQEQVAQLRLDVNRMDVEQQTQMQTIEVIWASLQNIMQWAQQFTRWFRVARLY